MEKKTMFVMPSVKVLYFDVDDIITTSGYTTSPTGPINPELPPDDDFE